MPKESLQNLRIDRRLLDRRGWISPSELEKELGSLPDVSDKAADPEEAPSAKSAPASDASDPA